MENEARVKKSNYPAFGCCFSLAICLLSGQALSVPVSQCDALQPPAKTGISLARWLLQEEKSFKELGCWQKHLGYGLKALEESRKNKQAEVEIGIEMELSLQLASSSFYLGDYPQAQTLSETGYQLAVQQGNTKAQVEGLYLLSAVARAQGRREDAISLGKSAVNKASDAESLAKASMNLGAAYSDISPKDLKQAKWHLDIAYQTFLKLEKKNDALRAGLRLVRVDYLQDKLDEAHKRLVDLAPLVYTPRGEMLYHYQMAKVLHRKSLWQQAKAYAENAKKQAAKLAAKQDKERIESLISAIIQQRFVD